MINFYYDSKYLAIYSYSWKEYKSWGLGISLTHLDFSIQLITLRVTIWFQGVPF